MCSDLNTFIGDNDTVIVVGNYGSGKTEVSINLAVAEKRAGKNVELADLDLVNPYFRSREARKQLQAIGINVVLPGEQYMSADLPIRSPSVAAMIRKKNILAILDVGGDGVGATVLSALAEAFKDSSPKVFQVVNPFRPYTETLEGCEEMRRQIEMNANMKITGLVGNANMMAETTRTHVRQGYAFMQDLSERNGLPLVFITVPDDVGKTMDMSQFSCHVLPIRRQLVPPWLHADKLT